MKRSFLKLEKNLNDVEYYEGVRRKTQKSIAKSIKSKASVKLLSMFNEEPKKAKFSQISLSDEFATEYDFDSDSSLTSLASDDTIVQDCNPIFEQTFEESYIETLKKKQHIEFELNNSQGEKKRNQSNR